MKSLATVLGFEKPFPRQETLFSLHVDSPELAAWGIFPTPLGPDASALTVALYEHALEMYGAKNAPILQTAAIESASLTEGEWLHSFFATERFYDEHAFDIRIKRTGVDALRTIDAKINPVGNAEIDWPMLHTRLWQLGREYGDQNTIQHGEERDCVPWPIGFDLAEH